MRHPYTNKIISSALFHIYKPSDKDISNIIGRNRGLSSFLGIKKYVNFMPTKVLKRLKIENAGDIELYNYALDLFNKNARLKSLK